MSAFDELGEFAVANEARVAIVYSIDDDQWNVVFTWQDQTTFGRSGVLSLAVSEALEEAGW